MALQNQQAHNYNPFPINEDGKYTVATDSKYQSTFLPLFQNAETQIKKQIVLSFWTMTSERILRLTIMQYIKNLSLKIPNDLANKEAYINGLIKKSDKMIRDYYQRARLVFGGIVGLIYANIQTLNFKDNKNIKLPKIDTPKQLMDILANKPESLEMNLWSEAKASVRVKDYPKQLKQFINSISNEPITTYETGKKPISLWQKAELDVRYRHQMEMIDELKTQGVEYAWISSHPDCSKRCEKWQGKLVALNKSATGPNFYVGKLDGNNVYSLPDIMAQTDKYGYNNNIICGFNCRHHLIKYEPNSLPPKHYSGPQIKKMRDINEKIRLKEREIRVLKTKQAMYNVVDKQVAANLEPKINMLIKQYVQYCEKYGFAAELYRIKIVK